MPRSVRPLIGRVERQHRLIEELRLRTAAYLSAEVLADRVGATTRTVQRDITDLQDAGVPVRTRRGLGGGYGMDTRRTLPPLVFTPGEAAALVVSLAAVGPRASATAQTAMDKLLAALLPAASPNPNGRPGGPADGQTEGQTEGQPGGRDD